MKTLKNTFKHAFWLAFGIMVLAGCKDNEPATPADTKGKLSLKVEVTANGEPVNLGSTYNTPAGQQYIMDLFKFYIGNISLVKNDDSEVLLKEVLLVDLSENIKEPFDEASIGKSFTFDVEQGQYKALKAGIGVPENINIVRNDLPNDHPLSIYRGTDWAWAGYRFIMLEGRARNSNSDPYNHFEYHIATDEFYQQKQWNKSIEITGGSTTGYTLSFDINDFVNPADQTRKLDFITEDFTHSEGSSEEIEIAWKVTNNFRDALGK